MKSERAVDRLIELLSDSNPAVRGNAAYALGQIKSERAEERLIELLGDRGWYPLIRAAYALGTISQSLPPIRQVEIAKKLKERFEELTAEWKVRFLPAISNLRDTAKRRFLDVFGPNFGWKH